jgi:hypothetical protein
VADFSAGPYVSPRERIALVAFSWRQTSRHRAAHVGGQHVLPPSKTEHDMNSKTVSVVRKPELVAKNTLAVNTGRRSFSTVCPLCLGDVAIDPHPGCCGEVRWEYADEREVDDE